MNRFRHRYFYITASVLLALVVVFVCVDRPVKQERRIVERIASGKAVPPHFYVGPWLWKGLVVNLGLAALLVAATPWATRKLGGNIAHIQNAATSTKSEKRRETKAVVPGIIRPYKSESVLLRAQAKATLQHMGP